MAETKKVDARTQDRQERIDEILAILDELYLDLGYSHAGPVKSGSPAPAVPLMDERFQKIAASPKGPIAPTGIARR
ncbi:MAG: hypothetical protein HY716_16375 [Planctomycetes bacterium]|nr:hypothetical protein [Planctomycetota bacterium]